MVELTARYIPDTVKAMQLGETNLSINEVLLFCNTGLFQGTQDNLFDSFCEMVRKDNYLAFYTGGKMCHVCFGEYLIKMKDDGIIVVSEEDFKNHYNIINTTNLPSHGG